jgi:hypothetical protein
MHTAHAPADRAAAAPDAAARRRGARGCRRPQRLVRARALSLAAGGRRTRAHPLPPLSLLSSAWALLCAALIPAQPIGGTPQSPQATRPCFDWARLRGAPCITDPQHPCLAAPGRPARRAAGRPPPGMRARCAPQAAPNPNAAARVPAAARPPAVARRAPRGAALSFHRGCPLDPRGPWPITQHCAARTIYIHTLAPSPSIPRKSPMWPPPSPQAAPEDASV